MVESFPPWIGVCVCVLVLVCLCVLVCVLATFLHPSTRRLFHHRSILSTFAKKWALPGMFSSLGS